MNFPPSLLDAQATEERTHQPSTKVVRGSDHRTEGREAVKRVMQPIGAGLVALVLFVGTFAFALHQPRPHGVPVGIVAPPPMPAKLQSALSARAPGAFALHRYASAAEAKEAIDHHMVDGAFVMTASSSRLYLATASGMADTELVSTVFAKLAQATGRRLTVRDLRPLPHYDPRGLTPFFLIVGLLISSMLFSVVLFVRARGLPLRTRVGVVLLFALLAGPLGALTVSAVAATWIPSFWEVSLICTTLSLSVALTTMALARVLGPVGIGLAAYMLIPLSASTAGGPVNYEFLPDILRRLSKDLPAGAALTALRNTLYFGGNSLGQEATVLLVWIAAALLVLGATAVRHPWDARRRTTG